MKGSRNELTSLEMLEISSRYDCRSRRERPSLFDFVDSVAGVMVGVPSGGEVECRARAPFIVGAPGKRCCFPALALDRERAETHIQETMMPEDKRRIKGGCPGSLLDLNGIEF